VDLCLGFRADEIITRIGASWRGVPVAHWREETLLGTAGGLRLVAAAATAGPADMVVINCDIVAELDFADLLARHRRYGGAASIVTALHAHTLRYGTIDTPGEGYAVTGLREKPQIVHRIIAGIYLFRTQALIGALPSGDGRLDMPDLLLRFLDDASVRMINLDLDGLWIDIGMPDDYDRARELFK
jgi:mannose-1-phosphate guanylyltransferase